MLWSLALKPSDFATSTLCEIGTITKIADGSIIHELDQSLDLSPSTPSKIEVPQTRRGRDEYFCTSYRYL